MGAAKRRWSWRRWLLVAVFAVPALAAALWFGNVWRLTRERDRVLAEAERFGPVLWNDRAEALLAEHRRNPGAAAQFKEALALLQEKRGNPSVFEADTYEWLSHSPKLPLPEHAVQTLVRGRDALERLHAVVGKPPGLLTNVVPNELPWKIEHDMFSDLRTAARLLQLEALAAEQAKDPRRAYRVALTASLLARQLDRDPFLLTWLTGTALDSTALGTALPAALRTGPPTEDEERRLEAAWAVPRDVPLQETFRLDVAGYASGCRDPGEWKSMCEHDFDALNYRIPSGFEIMRIWLEGTGAGLPNRLRAETAWLRIAVALASNDANAEELSAKPPTGDEPSLLLFKWKSARSNILTSTLPRERARAFCARLALQAAAAWRRDGRVPERWEDLGLPLPPEPQAKLRWERRRRGFAIGLDEKPVGEWQPVIAVEFPGAP